MKILVRYDLADINPVERGNISDSLAGKVFPVIEEIGEGIYKCKRRLGRSVKFEVFYVTNLHCTIHKPRTRHGNNNSPKNNS